MPMSDYNIIMSGKPIQLDNPIAVQQSAEALKSSQMKNALAKQEMDRMNSPEYKAEQEMEAFTNKQKKAKEVISDYLPHATPQNWNRFGQLMQDHFGDAGAFGQPYDPAVHEKMMTNFGIGPRQGAADYSGSLIAGEGGGVLRFNKRTGQLEDTGQKFGLKPTQELGYIQQGESSKAIGKALGEQQANIASGRPENALPLNALQAVQEKEDLANTATNITGMLDSTLSKIESGELNLGPLKNVISGAKNWSGLSDKQSRAYAGLMSDLEKMRNDSLRLNKGPQTDGDAERAWNELIQNINDPQLVRDRIQTIKALNQNAAAWHMKQANEIRSNFGASQQQNTQAASGKVMSLQILQRAAQDKFGGDINAAMQAAIQNGYTIGQ